MEGADGVPEASETFIMEETRARCVCTLVLSTADTPDANTATISARDPAASMTPVNGVARLKRERLATRVGR